MIDESDHDTLIRMSERILLMGIGLEADRAARNARDAKFDTQIRDVETEVESLRLSRAWFYGAAAGMSALISALIKVFWK
jgi:hypothetical protein